MVINRRKGELLLECVGRREGRKGKSMDMERALGEEDSLRERDRERRGRGEEGNMERDRERKEGSLRVGEDVEFDGV